MSLRAHYKTSTKAENDGIELVYGTTYVRCRRAGGSNKKYQAALAKALKPLGGAAQAGIVHDKQVLGLSVPVFVKHVIISWHTEIEVDSGAVDDNGKPVMVTKRVSGVEAENDQGYVEASTENMIAFLLEVPEFFDQLHADAKSRQFYLEDMEAAAGN